MAGDDILICTVTGDAEVSCLCVRCGEQLPPARTGAECGHQWDDHRARDHDTELAGAE